MTSRKVDLDIPNTPFPTFGKGLVLGPDGKIPLRVIPEEIKRRGGAAFSMMFGDGSSKVFNIPHNLGFQGVQVTVFRTNPPNDEVICEIEHTNDNLVTIRTVATPGSSEYTVVCSGPGEVSTSSGGTGDLNYVHNQAALADIWSVDHNLGKFPAISVVDTGNNEIVPNVFHDSANHATVSFAAPTSGKAFCN